MVGFRETELSCGCKHVCVGGGGEGGEEGDSHGFLLPNYRIHLHLGDFHMPCKLAYPHNTQILSSFPEQQTLELH